jgi:hypothetical protein
MNSSLDFPRHGLAGPSHPLHGLKIKDVDARHKAGHDASFNVDAVRDER